MKKNNDKIHNLGKKIYLLCYTKPRYKMEISKLIYGDPKKKGIYPEIKKLEKEGWIIKADSKIAKENNLMDIYKDKLDFSSRNAEKRQYYFSLLDPLKNAILDKLKKENIKFNNEEMKELDSILSLFLARDLIENAIKNYDFSKNIDFFERIFEGINFFNIVLVNQAIDQFSDKILDKQYIRVHYKLSKINSYVSELFKTYTYTGFLTFYEEALDLDGIKKKLYKKEYKIDDFFEEYNKYFNVK